MTIRRIGATLGFSALLTCASCVTDSNSVYILGIAGQSGSNCGYNVGQLVTGASIDPAVSGDVRIGLVVGNLIQRRTLNIANDPSTVMLDEAEVELFDAQGARLPGTNPFMADFSGLVIPGSANGSTPSTGVASILVLPAANLAALGGTTSTTTVTAQVTVRGRTNGHLDVEGGPFTVVLSIVPSGALAVDCSITAGTTQTCCSPGVDELYCVDAASAGLCLSN